MGGFAADDSSEDGDKEPVASNGIVGLMDLAGGGGKGQNKGKMAMEVDMVGGGGTKDP